MSQVKTQWIIYVRKSSGGNILLDSSLLQSKLDEPEYSS